MAHPRPTRLALAPKGGLVSFRVARPTRRRRSNSSVASGVVQNVVLPAQKSQKGFFLGFLAALQGIAPETSAQPGVASPLGPTGFTLTSAGLHDAQQQSEAVKGAELGWPTVFLEEYLLGKCVGSGAFGTVFKALARRSGFEVAVKMLRKTRAKQPREKTLRKLQREQQLMARVQTCKQVVRLFGSFEDENFAYLVMEHCSGGDLESKLEEWGRFSEHQSAVVLHQCLLVIAACHANNIVHGDVKPANFMFADRKAAEALRLQSGPTIVKAVDFGCSQLVAGGSLNRRTGTPVYMAPEVFNRSYGLQADMWSLGMMLFHLLTERFPYWHTMQECRNSSMDEVMVAVTTADISYNCEPFQRLSPECRDFIQRLLQRDPSRRITALEALQHPWFRLHSAALEAVESGEPHSAIRNNILPAPVPGAIPAEATTTAHPVPISFSMW